jgi:pantoate kinase
VVAIALGNYISEMTRPARLQLDLELDLPVGQGFGMSGAMTLAALLAAEKGLGLLGGDRDRLVAIAHAAEVEAGTGLGDVVPQAQGGMDLRLSPGAPPHSEVLMREADADVLVAWSPTPLHTSTVLSDPGARERLEAVCAPLLERADPDGGLDWLLEAGSAFTRDVGLASEDVIRMLEACSPHGDASQVMLGNSIFAIGDLESMGLALDELGYSWTTTRVDNDGARLLR